MLEESQMADRALANVTPERRLTQIDAAWHAGRKRQLHDEPHQRILQINLNRLSFGTARTSDESRPKRLKNVYQAGPKLLKGNLVGFLQIEQAGLSTLAIDAAHGLYTIRLHRNHAQCQLSLKNIEENRVPMPPLHGNVNALLNIFQAHDEIHMIYEEMKISLRQLRSTPGGLLNSNEISSVCKAVCGFHQVSKLSIDDKKGSRRTLFHPQRHEALSWRP